MVYIVLNKIPLLIKALSTVGIGRDAWATVICTPTAVILHTAADDQCCTAAGSIPKELFMEYRLGTTMTEIHERQKQQQQQQNNTHQRGSGGGGGGAAVVVAVDDDNDNAVQEGGADGLQNSNTNSGGSANGGSSAIGADCQFMVHVQSFIDSLTIGGASSLASPYLTASLSFPERDGRLLIELTEPANTTASGHARLLQSHLITRPLRERMLDLRFQDSLIANRLCLRSDVARELLNDLASFNSEHVKVSFGNAMTTTAGGGGVNHQDAAGNVVAPPPPPLGPNKTVAVSTTNAARHPEGFCAIEGLKGPYGDIQCLLDRSTDGVIALDVVDPLLWAKYPLTHFAVALSSGKWHGGVGGIGGDGQEGGGGGGRGRPRGNNNSSSDGNNNANASVPDLSTFSRVTLNFNRERQLCVMHRTREHDVQVRVDIVITPLSTLFDEED